MYITITFETDSEAFDVSIDERQEIRAALRALSESGKTKSGWMDYPFYRSLLQERLVSGNFTFEDAGIVTGDMLTGVE